MSRVANGKKLFIYNLGFGNGDTWASGHPSIIDYAVKPDTGAAGVSDNTAGTLTFTASGSITCDVYVWVDA